MARDGWTQGGLITVEWSEATPATLSITGPGLITVSGDVNAAGFPYPLTMTTAFDVDRNGPYVVTVTFGGFTVLSQTVTIRDGSECYLVPETSYRALSVAGLEGNFLPQSGTGFVLAPAPAGNKAIDEANVQPLLDDLSINGGKLILRKGDYLGDWVLHQGPTGEQLPTIVGQGERYTRINSLTIYGHQLHSSGCYLSDFGFYGQHPVTGVALDLVGTQSVHWDRLGFWRTHTVGIRFYSPTPADWVEKCSGQANFGDNCYTPLKYQADGGTGSHNSCGLTMGSEINQRSGSTAPLIDIGTNAYPYHAPLSAHIWVQNDAQPLIRNNGKSTSNFCGNLRIEQLGSAQSAKLVDPAGTNPVYYAGTLSVQGYARSVSRSRFVLCSFIGVEGVPYFETTANMPVIATQTGKYMAIGQSTSTSGSLGGGTLRLIPHYIPHQITIDRVCAEVTVAGDVGSVVRLGIYRDAGARPENALPIVDTTVPADSVGIQEATLSPAVTLVPGWYWFGGAIQGTPATLTSALSTSGAITSLPVSALTVAIPNGAVVVVTHPSSQGLQQNYTVNGAHAVGATSLAVTSTTPNFAYPIGSTVGYVNVQPTLRTVTQSASEFPIMGEAASNVMSNGYFGHQRGSVTQALPAFGAASSNNGPTAGAPKIAVRLA